MLNMTLKICILSFLQNCTLNNETLPMRAGFCSLSERFFFFHLEILASKKKWNYAEMKIETHLFLVLFFVSWTQSFLCTEHKRRMFFKYCSQISISLCKGAQSQKRCVHIFIQCRFDWLMLQKCIQSQSELHIQPPGGEAFHINIYEASSSDFELLNWVAFHLL